MVLLGYSLGAGVAPLLALALLQVCYKSLGAGEAPLLALTLLQVCYNSLGAGVAPLLALALLQVYATRAWERGKHHY